MRWFRAWCARKIAEYEREIARLEAHQETIFARWPGLRAEVKGDG